MSRLTRHGLVGVWLSLCVLQAPALSVAADRWQGRPAASITTVSVTVTLPHGDATLEVDGRPIPGLGTSRQFESAPLEPGREHRAVFTATWQPNTYTTMTRSRTVSLRSGSPVTVDLAAEDPGDRVRVSYVPTPTEIADAMVALAGVTADDVAYEPGCGDARITIAAVKRGARRGVGIDIDPDRVAESRRLVEEAGLADRIEIRLGDALDIPDLSSATVVFLYMGDHFNLLIRPRLWRDLPVGARVVSHRFAMGDWTPDKSVTVTSDDGGNYELHLWTVTEAQKRQVGR